MRARPARAPASGVIRAPDRALAFAAASLLLAAGLPFALADHGAVPDAARDIRFTSKSGGEWWVQVSVGGADASAVTAVEAQDTGGAWVALQKRSWGDWAASFRVEPGHEVRFVARFSDGGHVTSCWMSHPAGVPRCEDGGGAFAFDHNGGNEWWVQVRVAPTPRAVQAMDTGGAWTSLTLRSWGDWAASFRVEPGHEVRFRAQDAAGVWTESCWFTHPAGVAQDCGGGGDANFTATFRTSVGNEWWVATHVDANEPLAGVDARIVGSDAWRALTKRSWGAWAASFHVPDGSLVEFRARSTDGDVAVSEKVYRWPTGAAEDRGAASAWPREGSYLSYLIDSGESVPGWSEDTWLWLNYTYSAGRWAATCEGWRIERVDEYPEERERLVLNVTAPPPLGGPRLVEPGQGVEIRVPTCYGEGGETMFVYVTERAETSTYHGSEPRHKNGEPVTIPVWSAWQEDDDCPCGGSGALWHWDTGITVDAGWFGRYSGGGAHLLDTDAPVSKDETSVPPKPAWPREGSFAAYKVNLTDDYSDAVERIDVRFTYAGGAWSAVCTGEEGPVAAAPPMAPTRTQRGASVWPTDAWPCGISPPPVVVQGQFPHQTTKDGRPHTATVWWGDEADGVYGDEDAWWDVATGLVLKWEDHGGYFRGDEGWLVDTDAPLSG